MCGPDKCVIILRGMEREKNASTREVHKKCLKGVGQTNVWSFRMEWSVKKCFHPKRPEAVSLIEAESLAHRLDSESDGKKQADGMQWMVIRFCVCHKKQIYECLSANMMRLLQTWLTLLCCVKQTRSWEKACKRMWRKSFGFTGWKLRRNLPETITLGPRMSPVPFVFSLLTDTLNTSPLLEQTKQKWPMLVN